MKKIKGFTLDVPEELEPLLKKFGVDKQDGYQEHFTRQQADGAIENGRTIVKVNSKLGDLNPDGTLGMVLGSMNPYNVGIGYFIEWETMPGRAIFTPAAKVSVP